MAKHAERQEAYRLFVEEGLHDFTELAHRCDLSTSTLRKFLGPEAKKDFHTRCREARRLYVEKGLTDVESLCHQARIHPNLWLKIYRVDWDEERARYVADNPTLYRTGELLYQAAEGLLNQIRTSGYNDENVDKLVKLANAHERFRTGEYRLESILMGLGEFVAWFRDEAKTLGIKPREVKHLALLIGEFRRAIESRMEAVLR